MAGQEELWLGRSDVRLELCFWQKFTRSACCWQSELSKCSKKQDKERMNKVKIKKSKKMIFLMLICCNFEDWTRFYNFLLRQKYHFISFILMFVKFIKNNKYHNIKNIKIS